MNERRQKPWSATTDASGFTVLEMAAVTAIMAALSAIVAVAVTGAAINAHSSSKTGDLRSVETAVNHHTLEFGQLAYFGSADRPSIAVAGAGFTDTIRIVVTTAAEDFTYGTLPVGPNVVTCESQESTSIAQAAARCFAAIDFSVLIPTFIKKPPKHHSDYARTRDGLALFFDDDLSTADATFTECTLSGETCAIYFADQGDAIEEAASFSVPTDAFKVWNVDAIGGVVILLSTEEYARKTPQ